jgi:hypothetical protein
MPYLDLRLNGKKLAVGGDPQLDLLSLTVVASRDAPESSLYLGGMRTTSAGMAEQVCWSRRQLVGGDRLRVTAFSKAEADKPIDERVMRTTLGHRGLPSREEGVNTPSINSERAGSQLIRPSFEIQFSDSTFLSVGGVEETLQLVATWPRGNDSCTIQVDSLTVLEDGTTNGQTVADRILRPSEWFELRLSILRYS